jgi:hypothetical protein
MFQVRQKALERLWWSCCSRKSWSRLCEAGSSASRQKLLGGFARLDPLEPAALSLQRDAPVWGSQGRTPPRRGCLDGLKQPSNNGALVLASQNGWQNRSPASFLLYLPSLNAPAAQPPRASRPDQPTPRRGTPHPKQSPRHRPNSASQFLQAHRQLQS